MGQVGEASRPVLVKPPIATPSLERSFAGFAAAPPNRSTSLQTELVTPECLQYALSQPASVVIHGMDKLEYLEQTAAAPAAMSHYALGSSFLILNSCIKGGF
jgi:hypothetical protein